MSSQAETTRRLALPRTLTGLVVLLAFWLSLFVPSGFMLDRSPSGEIGAVPCSGYGPMGVEMESRGKHRRDGREGGWAQHGCSFASHAAPVLGPPPSPALVLEHLFEEGSAFALPQISVRVVGLAAPPPPSHAPPSSAI